MTGWSLISTFRQASDRGVAVLMLLLLMLASPDSGAAQPQRDTRAGSAQSRLPSADDKTGTNPLNLQQTVAVLNDFESLPDGLFFNRAVYSYTMPLARRRLAARVELPLVMSNVTGRTEGGFGDVGVRAVWTPPLAARAGLLVGVDTTWGTATNSTLGIGRHTLAPLVQVVLFPSARTIVAPRYSQRLSLGGQDRPDINRAVFGLYTAWLPDPAMWIVVEPEIAFDLVRNQTGGDVAFEWGRLLFGGLGTYIRPGVGLGRIGAKPFDWTLEVGFRIIP